MNENTSIYDKHMEVRLLDEPNIAGERGHMPIHRILDRFALILAVTLFAAFLAMHEPASAFLALALWPLTRALISILDVFVLFFTQKPLVRRPVCRTISSEARVDRAGK